MSVFGNYARYYDLLYKEKDYAGETSYIHDLLQQFGKNPKSILELGCGTGKHAMLLAEKGYAVAGVDQSEEMLAQARERLKSLLNNKIELKLGDVRNVRLNKQFDAVISLFHVMSYHITNADLCGAFETAKVHLKPGGIFIFDCWYGPAVLTEKPAVRIKRLEDEHIHVTRIAEPLMHPNDNIVDVNYAVFIRDKKTGQVEELTEKHRMRYLFSPEVKNFLLMSKLDFVAEEEWMSRRSPGFNTWGTLFVARLS
jgi:SAM-dependent methyltransferase